MSGAKSSALSAGEQLKHVKTLEKIPVGPALGYPKDAVDGFLLCPACQSDFFRLTQTTPEKNGVSLLFVCDGCDTRQELRLQVANHIDKEGDATLVGWHFA